MTGAAPPLRITWLGHATALIDIGGVRLLTDPVLRNRVGPLVRISRPVPVDALQPIDGVLLSHLHADHTDSWSLRAIARTVPVLAPRPAARWLGSIGLERVIELSAGEEAVIGGVQVRATPATHDGRRRPLGPKADPIGYLISGGQSVYFAGDTDLFPAMADLRGLVGVSLVPVWGWGRSLGPGHLDPERAARAVAMIGPRVAIPIHWGTFALGLPVRSRPDPAWPARRFAELTRERAPEVDVRLLSPGERTEL
jgi:L-ascorbate metabolism protein UlaG (beta-lactamase superfamily)